MIAKITGYADAAQAPELFTTAPALATPKAISNAGLEASQIDFYEINEAFAGVALANQKLLGLNSDKSECTWCNCIFGTPSRMQWCSYLGHTFRGQKNGKYGVGGVCNGGGGASSFVVELV